MRLVLISAAASVLALSGASLMAQNAAPAQPGAQDLSRITGGTYSVDPGHTQVAFAFDHMGITKNYGLIAGPSSGSLMLDRAQPGAAKVKVTFPVANIRTAVPKLDEHLMTADFFEAAKFPTATFESTSVKVDADDPGDAEITGNLTIKGITRPVTLDVDFTGAGANPMSKKETVGFSASGAIKRSEFGLGYGVPMVGDVIELQITAAFEK